MDWDAPGLPRHVSVWTPFVEIISRHGATLVISLEHGDEGDQGFTLAADGVPKATTVVPEDLPLIRMKFELTDTGTIFLPPKPKDGGSGGQGESPT